MDAFGMLWWYLSIRWALLGCVKLLPSDTISTLCWAQTTA